MHGVSRLSALYSTTRRRRVAPAGLAEGAAGFGLGLGLAVRARLGAHGVGVGVGWGGGGAELGDEREVDLGVFFTGAEPEPVSRVAR